MLADVEPSSAWEATELKHGLPPEGPQTTQHSAQHCYGRPTDDSQARMCFDRGGQHRAIVVVPRDEASPQIVPSKDSIPKSAQRYDVLIVGATATGRGDEALATGHHPPGFSLPARST
jgi:hypothetical protein